MSLYDDLDITPDADDATIKRAHRKAVKKLHPDAGENSDRDKFETVQRAFMVLSNPERRSRYDETGTIDDAPDNQLGIIAEVIMRAFDEAFQRVGDQFRFVDMIAQTRERIENRKDETKIARSNLKAQIEQIERILKRVTFKSGNGFNPIANTLEERIRDGRNAQAMAEREAEGIEAALAYLDHYGFEFEKAPTQTVFHGTVTWL